MSINIEKGATTIGYFKEYLSIIIVLPSLLGGFWQLYSLMTISPSYIRFFSISQVVPDGLLILYFIICLLMPLVIVIVSVKYYVKRQKAKNIKSTFTPKSCLGAIFSLGFYAVLIWACYYFYIEVFINKAPQVFEIVLFNFFSALTILLLMGVIVIIFNRDSIVLLETNHSKRKNIYILVISLFLYLIMSLFCFRVFDAQYVIPENLLNVDKLDRIISSKDYRIVYYNDSYIFFETRENYNGKPKYRVLKFEVLVNNEQ